MHLNDLTVYRGENVVRTVPFKAGLNLILDVPTVTATESGNSVGKTTVLRLIDFCFGSDGDDIWTDAEFKKVNQEIYDYLHGPVEVRVVLRLTKFGKLHELSRAFCAPGKKNVNQFQIDGIRKTSIREYRNDLKIVVFGSSGEKPSLRQLIPKFVRSSPGLMSRTLKYLGDFTGDASYEPVHLFLFGFTDVEVLALRPKLATERKRIQRDLQAVTRERKEGELEQLLIHLRREIDEIDTSTQSLATVPEISKRADVIAGVRARASKVSGALGGIESEIASLELSISELGAGHEGIDHKAIESIYKEASSYLPKLHHDWEELSEFVHSLRGRKQRFLALQLAHLQAKAQELGQQLTALQKEEADQLKDVSHLPDFARALSIRVDLQEKYKRLGSLEQDLADIRALRSEQEAVSAKLEETQVIISSAKTQLSERVAKFNAHFSKLSKALYGEEYLLHFEEKGNVVVFQLTAVGANVGAGKKMSQTAAFDLAYMRFVQEAKLPFPTFACHDGLEAIHGNQLSALLTESDEKSGQFIVATLRDKLPKMPGGFIDAHTAIALSHGDKFFKI